MLPLCDLFVSCQGEGIYSGVPSIFIRVSGCNLRCVFKGSICDTPYSSFSPEKSSFTEDDVKKIIKDNPQVDHIVITGGEPLLYKKELEQLLTDIWEDRFVVTIETNGTLPILNPLTSKYKVALYSVSPKLHTSMAKAGEHVMTPKGEKIFGTEEVERLDNTRINIKALTDIVMQSNDYQFKFVYSGPECIDEIESIYKKMAGYADKFPDRSSINYYRNHKPELHTMLMPEGITEAQLAEKRLEIAEVCIKKGWRYTDRLHITIWGDKRGK